MEKCKRFNNFNTILKSQVREIGNPYLIESAA